MIRWGHEPSGRCTEINRKIPDGFEEIVAKCLAQGSPPPRAAALPRRGKGIYGKRGFAPCARRGGPPRAGAEGEGRTNPFPTAQDRGGNRTPTLFFFLFDRRSRFPRAEAETGGTPVPEHGDGGGARVGSSHPHPRPQKPGATSDRRFAHQLTNVRTPPTWGRRIPPAGRFFLAITEILVIGLMGKSCVL